MNPLDAAREALAEAYHEAMKTLHSLPVNNPDANVSNWHGGKCNGLAQAIEILAALVPEAKQEGRGQKILDGLRDAVEGNFARVHINGQEWTRTDKQEGGGSHSAARSDEAGNDIARPDPSSAPDALDQFEAWLDEPVAPIPYELPSNLYNIAATIDAHASVIEQDWPEAREHARCIRLGIREWLTKPSPDRAPLTEGRAKDRTEHVASDLRVGFPETASATPEQPSPDQALDPEQAIADAYQIVGAIADQFGVHDHPEVVRALDYLAYGKTEDGSDILPWPREPLKPSPDQATPSQGDVQKQIWLLESLSVGRDFALAHNLSTTIDMLKVLTAARAESRAEVDAAQIVCDSYVKENQQFHDRFTAAEAEVERLTAENTRLDLAGSHKEEFWSEYRSALNRASAAARKAGEGMRDFRKAVGVLVVAARTSGGVAGRDEGLCAALDAVEAFYVQS